MRGRKVVRSEEARRNSSLARLGKKRGHYKPFTAEHLKNMKIGQKKVWEKKRLNGTDRRIWSKDNIHKIIHEENGCWYHIGKLKKVNKIRNKIFRLFKNDQIDKNQKLFLTRICSNSLCVNPEHYYQELK